MSIQDALENYVEKYPHNNFMRNMLRLLHKGKTFTESQEKCVVKTLEYFQENNVELFPSDFRSNSRTKSKPFSNRFSKQNVNHVPVDNLDF